MLSRLGRFLALASLVLLTTGQLRLVHHAVAHDSCGLEGSGHAAAGETDHSHDEQPQPGPEHSEHDCPVCHHLASLGSFVSTSVVAGLLPAGSQAIDAATSERPVGRVIERARSRAPPRFA